MTRIRKLQKQTTWPTLIIIIIHLCASQVLGLRPPKIISTFEPEYWYQKYNTVSMTKTCIAINGNITYRWTVRGADVLNTREVAVDTKKGTITFQGLTSDNDYGTYQCFAMNSLGVALSAPFELKTPVMGTFSDTIPATQSCNESMPCTIPCRSRGTFMCEPKASCSEVWILGQGLKGNVAENSRTAVDNDGNLIFSYAELGDYQNGQPYACALWNEEIRTMKKGGPTTLTVKPSGLQTWPPELAASNGGKGLLKGNATLTCIFSGKPVPEITWESPQGQVIYNRTEKYKIIDFGRRLVVENLVEEDKGDYKCIGRTVLAGQGMAVGYVYLNVTSPPMLTSTSTMEDKYVERNGETSFICDTESLAGQESPSPTKWMKNGGIIASGAKFFISADGNTLTIRHAQKSIDTGNYQCSSTNSEGLLFKDAFLMVIDPITLTLTMMPSYKIKDGEQIKLGVDAYTDPNFSLMYAWTFVTGDGQRINVTNNQYWMLSNNNKNLTVNTPFQKDNNQENFRQVFGQYEVRIYNDAQERIIATVLESETNPAAPLVPVQAASPDLWFIAIIFGVIVLIVIIVLIVCMLNRNRGGTYPVDKKEVAAGHDPERELADSGIHDLSRADDDDIPKSDRMSLSEYYEKPLESDEDDMEEYGDVDVSKFNEDGSFIGMYINKTGKSEPTQSTV